jgi:MoxR-like ATPase
MEARMSDVVDLGKTELGVDFEKADHQYQERLDRLAGRLGVQPLVGSDNFNKRFLVGSTKGPAYDVFDLVHALLDKMEAATGVPYLDAMEEQRQMRSRVDESAENRQVDPDAATEST